MSRVFWIALFAAVPLAGTAIYALAALNIPPFNGWGLPENASAGGGSIDRLFWIIHALAAGVLLGVGGLLTWVLWRDSRREKACYLRGSLRWELVWTGVTGSILIALAILQVDVWADAKIRRPRAGDQPLPALARLVARQFGWEVYYPGPDGVWDTADDLYLENELWVPVDTEVVLELRSRDVIHSFFVPALRVKQDVVPGMTQRCWFRVLPAYESRRFDFVCAELCGWGHYRMNGVLTAVSRREWARRLEQLDAARRGARVVADRGGS